MKARASTPVTIVVLITERLLCCSDSAEPVVTIVLPVAAAPLTDHCEAVDELDFPEIFWHLIAELALDPHPQGCAVLDRKCLAVHAVGEDRLPVTGVGEIDRAIILNSARKAALDGIHAVEHHVTRMRLCLCLIQNQRQRHARPLGNAAPAFDTVMARDLSSRRHRLQLGKAQGQRLLDQSGNLEAPIREVVGEQRLVALVVGRSDAVRPLRLADVGFAEFLRKSTVGRKPSLNPIGQVIGTRKDAAYRAVAVEPVEHVASREHEARSADCGAGEEAAARYRELRHRALSLASARYQPVMIDRSSLSGPAARIMTI